MKNGACILLALVMVTLVLTLGGCTKDAKTGYIQGVTDSLVKVGWVGPLSGPMAVVGVPLVHGMEAYFKMVNAQGGINGRQIELITKDDQFKPDIALQKAEELVEADKVFAIVGQLGTPGCLATLDFFKEKGIPCVYQGTGVSKFAETKGNYFPVQPNYTFEGRLLVKYALESLNAKSIAVIYGNDDAGKEGIAGIKAQLRGLGKEEVLRAEVPFNIQDIDFSVHVQKAAAVKPDVTVILGYQTKVPAILLEAQKQGFVTQFLTSYINADLTVLNLAKEAANGLIVTAWLPDITNPQNVAAAKFIETFQKYFPNEVPNAFAAAGWVAAEVFCEGLKRTGKNVTWEGFIKAMETFRDWSEGLAQGITYTPDRRNGVERMYFMKAVYDEKGPRFEIISDWVSLY